MTNVSKNLLDQKTQEKLFSQLSGLFATADKSSARQFFSELLTPSERVMLMKRLAVIIMLDKECSVYRTATTLHMSKTTVAELQGKMQKGVFTSIIRVTHKKDFDSKKFWATIEVLVRAGMPSMGKDRWNSLRM